MDVKILKSKIIIAFYINQCVYKVKWLIVDSSKKFNKYERKYPTYDVTELKYIFMHNNGYGALKEFFVVNKTD